MVTASGLAWTDTLSAFPDTACKGKNLVQERKCTARIMPASTLALSLMDSMRERCRTKPCHARSTGQDMQIGGQRWRQPSARASPARAGCMHATILATLTGPQLLNV